LRVEANGRTNSNIERGSQPLVYLWLNIIMIMTA
jgi:hypothetical protein